MLQKLMKRTAVLVCLFSMMTLGLIIGLSTTKLVTITDDGFKGEVHSVNVLRQLVKVLIDVDNEKELREYKVEQLRFRRKHRHNKVDVADEELKALEKLEREEPKSKLEDN